MKKKKQSGLVYSVWREEMVWKKRDIEPAEAELRIRKHVRPMLQEARRLIGRGWRATWKINKIDDFVDQWFGGETQVSAAAETMTSETKHTDAQSSADKMKGLIAELKKLVERYEKEV